MRARPSIEPEDRLKTVGLTTTLDHDVVVLAKTSQ